MFENDGTPYFVSLARGTKPFLYILRKYGTALSNNCKGLNDHPRNRDSGCGC